MPGAEATAHLPSPGVCEFLLAKAGVGEGSCLQSAETGPDLCTFGMGSAGHGEPSQGLGGVQALCGERPRTSVLGPPGPVSTHGVA